MKYSHSILSIVLLAGLSAACGGDDPEQQAAATHEDIEGSFRSCGLSSCHGTPKAELQITGTPNLRELFVDVPACEAPSLKLVEPGNPDRSWLYIKLTAPVDERTGALIRDESWGEPATDCPDADMFGVRMPQGGMLPAEEVEAIRSWIASGAPGPSD